MSLIKYRIMTIICFDESVRSQTIKVVRTVFDNVAMFLKEVKPVRRGQEVERRRSRRGEVVVQHPIITIIIIIIIYIKVKKFRK